MTVGSPPSSARWRAGPRSPGSSTRMPAQPMARAMAAWSKAAKSQAIWRFRCPCLTQPRAWLFEADHHDRQVLLQRCHEPVHADGEPAVTAHRDDRTVGMHELGGQGGGDGVAHAAHTGRLEERRRTLGLEVVGHEDAVLAGVAGDDAIGGDRLLQGADHPLGQDRHLVGVELGGVEVAVLQAGVVQGGPAGVAHGRGHLADGVGELVERQPGVAQQHDRGRERPGRVAGLDVDLDELLAERVDEQRILGCGVGRAELGADGQDDVGAPDHGVGQRGAEVAHHAQRPVAGLGIAALARLRWWPRGRRAGRRAPPAGRRPGPGGHRCRRR